MRNGQTGSLNDLIAVEEEIEVEGPRPQWTDADSLGFGFDLIQEVEQGLGSKVGLERGGRVGERACPSGPPIGGFRKRADRLNANLGGAAAKVRMAVSRLSGVAEITPQRDQGLSHMMTVRIRV